jgi:hypothetical protein
MGDLESARALFEEVLTARRDVLSPDHPDTLATMNQLEELEDDST